MGGKKKKKGKKKKEKKEGEEDEPKEENPLFTVNLPQYGWIRVCFTLCNPILPGARHNNFYKVMRADERVLELEQRIIDFHGRVEAVSFYNMDPYPPTDPKDPFKAKKKPNVPPFRHLDHLLKLKQEKEDKEEEFKKLEKKKEGNPDFEDDDKLQKLDADIKKIDVVLSEFIDKDDKSNDFHKVLDKYVVHYDHKEISLYEIFGEYGTAKRPKEHHPSKDEKPEPKPPKEVPPKQPTPKKPVEEKKGEEEEGENPDAPDEEGGPPEDNEPEEEVYIPPVDRTIYYDFNTHNGKDPILLALMIKDEDSGKTM